jgi:DNA repair protein RadA/Sms
MARPKVVHVCQQCGHESGRWLGRCPACDAWNSLKEETREGPARVRASLDDAARPIALDDVDTRGQGEMRVRTGIGELDSVLGGGIVSGSVILIGGDPGVGKSTLLLMALDRFAKRGVHVLYVTGEESARQVRMRADRLGVSGATLLLLPHTDFSHVEQVVRDVGPQVVVVDSIQTVHLPEIDSLPGSVTQVREVAHRAMLLAKKTGTAVMLVGHVTRSGDIAGPKVLEHLVDTVLYFEGDGRSALRILRAVKNRFGAAGELGVFEMFDEGLREVPDASARLLQERVADAPGTAVVSSLEGSRPLLTEVQALVGRPSPSTPARTCVGVDRTRVLMLAAVLEKHGLPLHDRDVFVNAAGGVRLDEPAADLGILAALASSLCDRPVRADTIMFGEIGLVGEIRAVSHPGLRLREAARHGFRRAIAPGASAKDAPAGLSVVSVRTVREALEAIW